MADRALIAIVATRDLSCRRIVSASVGIINDFALSPGR
jgi:hypothetical protein